MRLASRLSPVLGLASLIGCSTEAPAPSENHAPSAPEVFVTPASATTAEDLVVGFTAESEDVDLDEVSYRYAWSVDGAERPDLTTDTVPASETQRDQVWTVTVTPNDGTDDGEAATASATIVNSVPTASLTLSPDAPRIADEVVATFTAEDLDGDAVDATYAWTVDGAASDQADGTLPAGVAHRGEVWTLTVTFDDGTDAGEPALASVTFLDTPPSLESVALSPDPAFVTDTFVAAATGASDADGDSVALTYTFTVDGAEVQSGTDAELLPGSFTKHQSVAVSVVPDDGSEDGAAVVSAAVVVQDSAPSVTGAHIEPTSLTEESTATCVADGYVDADGDAPVYTYTWSVNGTEVATTETIDGSLFSKGDNVMCRVEPSDGEQGGPGMATAPVLVDDTAPVITAATLSTTAPTSDQMVDVDVTSTDVDGDTVSYNYEWFVNGTSVSTARSLSGDLFSRGDTLYAVVTPQDGMKLGAAYTSDVGTGVNGVPSVGGVGLGPSSAGTSDTLTANATGADPDGDPVTLAYAWYVNGALVAETGASLDGTIWFDRGDTVYVEVTPSDPTSTGTATASSTVTIGNARPTAPTISVSPSSPMVGEDLVCEVTTAATDADGDPLTYTFTWRVGPTTFTGTTTTTLPGDTVPGDSTAPRDNWVCSAVANDGTTDGPGTFSSVSVDPTLSAWYPFDGNADDGTAASRDGTVTGATLTTDRHGVADAAYAFDGVSDYIAFGAVTYASPVSVAAWVRSTAVNDVYNTVVGWNDVASPFGGLQLLASGSGDYRARAGGESDDLYSTSAPDGDGAWHLLVVTRSSAGDVSFYVDGVLEDTGTSTTSIGTGHQLYVGKSFRPDSFDEFFAGEIDDVRVYSDVLDASEVARLAAL